MAVPPRPASSARACRRGPSARCAANFAGLLFPDGSGGKVSKGSETPGEALKNRGRTDGASRASPAGAQAGKAAAEQVAPVVVRAAALGRKPGQPDQQRSQRPGPMRRKYVQALATYCLLSPTM